MVATCLVTLALVGAIAALIYLFFVWNFGYWKQRGVREAKATPLYGSFPSMFTQKRHMVYDIDEIYSKFKNDENFVGVYTSRIPQLLLLNGEIIHKIYVNNFQNFHDNELSTFVDEKSDTITANNPFFVTGDKWKERRAEIVPGLSPNRIKNAYPVTLEVCKRFKTYIDQQRKMSTSEGIDANELCLRFTSDVVTDCVLGIKADSLTDKPSPILDHTKRLFEITIVFLIYQILVGLLPAIKHVYKMNMFPKNLEQFFLNLMKQAIELRRSQKNDRADFLNYLMQLQEKKQLSTNEMAAHVMTFLTDGFITTATVVAHTLLALAREPSKQEKLYNEIMQNLDENETLSFDKLSEMPYLDACLHEALRIYTPFMFINKICTAPFEFTHKNGKTLQFKKGEVIMIPTYSLHHDERHYEQPEEFQPERFLAENGGVKKFREKGVFMGFGDGPRMCIGMRFALTQGKAAVVEIVKNFTIKPNPKTRSDNYFDKASFIATLDGGIWLDFEPRK